MVSPTKNKKRNSKKTNTLKKIDSLIYPKNSSKKRKKRAVRKEKKEGYEKLVRMLVENFLSMQKVYSNTAQKIEDLSVEISKLLQLFELSAKSFAEKIETSGSEIEKDREFLNKLNALLDQNKLIAKGLTLMEEKLKHRVYGNYPKQTQESRSMYQPITSPSRSNFIPDSSKKFEKSTPISVQEEE